MPFAAHSFDFYYNQLISRAISKELLDGAIQKGADVARIFSAIQHDTIIFADAIQFQYEWQLLLLGGADFDIQLQPVDFFTQKDNHGSMPCLYIALSGRHDSLTWINDNHPELLNRLIAHWAAWSGQTDTLAWIHSNYPKWLTSKDSGGRTIAHLAVLSGRPEILDWINDNSKLKALLSETDRNGETIVHWAAKSGQIESLNWIHQAIYTALLAKKDRQGFTIADRAAQSENWNLMAWIKDNSPAILAIQNSRGATLVHRASANGRIDVLNWFKMNCPELLAGKDREGNTIVHHAAFNGQIDSINYLLQECPTLLKTLWVCNQKGDTPHMMAKQSMVIKPNQLRDSELLAATNRQIDGQPKLNDMALLIAFQLEWRSILQKEEGYNPWRLINSVKHFARGLQSDITALIPKHELLAFSFDESVITQKNLNELVRLTLCAIPFRRPVFFVDSRPLLLQQAQLFVTKLDRDTLTEKQTFCLQLIVKDYEQGLLGKTTWEMDVLVKKLLASVTLTNLRPKIEMTTSLDICVENFPDYFKAFSERVALLPLSEYEAKSMRDIVLPGIKSIFRDEDAIVQHISAGRAELYFLNGNMPLHTDHVRRADAGAYRQTLRHLLINFFGAVDIAHNKGRLTEFCGKISRGHCLEGRVREAFIWVASLTDIVSFDDLMYRYIHQEYVPYTEVMFDVSVEGLTSDSTVCEFIMTRHKRTPCIIHSTYAPTGEVTEAGVKKYLTDVLDFALPEEYRADV